MKLLITTQNIDKNDPILGFFHRWVEEFAKHFEHIYVICLSEGEHTLPANVTVYSLGKESGENMVKYVWRFYTHLWTLNGKYDAVFSHMNPHYILLGGLVWRLQKKNIFFWRNHARMNIMTRIASVFAKRIFYTSPYACTARYAHAVKMPVGIDTERFDKEDVLKERTQKKKILFLGRLSPVKRVDLLVEVAKLLPDTHEVHIYGDAPKKDEIYGQQLRAQAGSNVYFHNAVKNTDTPAIYRAHDVFVNLTPRGSMDKTVLEASACGTMAIITNESFLNTIDPISYIEDVSVQSILDTIIRITSLDTQLYTNSMHTTRAKIIEHESLVKLGDMLYNYIHEQN